MNKLLRTTLALSAAAAAAAAQGATSNTTMAVSATIPISCSVTANPLAFGNLSTTGQTTANGSMSVTCSSGTTYQVGLDKGQHFNGSMRAMVHATNSSSFVTYKVFQPAPNSAVEWGDNNVTYPAAQIGGVGNGSAQALSFTAQNFSWTGTGGNYSDTVAVTVTF